MWSPFRDLDADQIKQLRRDLRTCSKEHYRAMSNEQLRYRYDWNLRHIKAGDAFVYGYAAEQYRAAQEMRRRGLIARQGRG